MRRVRPEVKARDAARERARHAARMADPAYLARETARAVRRSADPAHRAKRRARYAEDAEHRAKILAAAAANRAKPGNKERASAYNAAYWTRSENRARATSLNIAKKYGIDPARVSAVTECNICKDPIADRMGGPKKAKRRVVDHDHVTGKVRGILCNRCNAALGLMGDNLKSVERLGALFVAYLGRNLD